ncbi:hypothetical protein [Bradyrhizobium sp. AZCC 2289]|uniref:hypothetical protein n=1 Tax=Bradyrhizobium sp. AZCC 2289 TaxID=3117026 RepID=UPI002FF0BCCB
MSLFLAATALSTFTGGAAFAVDGDANDILLKKMEKMEQRIQSLEAELKQKQVAKHEELAKPARTSALQANAKDPNKDPNKDPIKDADKDTSKGGNKDAGKDPNATASPADATDLRTKSTGKAPGTPTSSPDLPILGLAASPVVGLSIGAYGEIKYGAMQNPAANGQWQNGFDAARFVLLPTYAITDNIIFNAEIEFEHAGSGFDADDKLHGTAEIEQIWIDFKIIDQFNWRSPGIDLVPIGYINQHHEPTQFYSVNRPELYNGLIPSTFKAGASSVYGTIADGLSYQVQVSSSLEDFGGDFGLRTDANTVPPFPIGYAPGISGLDALAFAAPVRGGFSQLSDAVAVAGKLDFAPAFVPGFAGSISGYYSPNVTPRGAYADTGELLGRTSLGIFDAEFRYRIPTTGLELRGEYVWVNFGHPENLRANNDTDPINNVGKTMYGYSGEIAYHVPLGTILNSEWEAVPFYRYTYENLQTGGFAGTDANMPTGAGQRTFHTAGLAVFPSPKLVLKATYQRVIDKSVVGALSDSFLGGVGFFF